jgi:hypothetical protein
MVRIIALAVLGVLASTNTASAQLAVIDPANLQQTVLIAQRTQRHLEELRDQYLVILRMSRGLGDLGRYRTPPIAGALHTPARWPYAAAWLRGLNTGDPTGSAYGATTIPLRPVESVPRNMSASAQRTLSNQIASMELSDSVAMMAGHQIGAIRQYNGVLQKGVDSLEEDVMNDLARYHELTAILDKVAAGELLGRRQDMAANQLLSHAIEQLLARGKRLRDAEALTMNMQLTTWRDASRANDAMVSGTADALRTWRQP